MKKVLCLMFIMLCVSVGVANAVPMLHGTADFAYFGPDIDRPWTATVQWEVYAPDTTNPYGLGSGHYYSYFYKITNSGTSISSVDLLSIAAPAWYAPLLTIGDDPSNGGGNTPVDSGMHHYYFDYHFTNGSDNSMAPGESSDWLYGTSRYAPLMKNSTLSAEGTSNVQKVGSPNGSPLPEPASMVLLGIGLAGLAGRKLSRKFKA